MLFWAVDNPAPANYLLISGDRDFSNALHQLRMRRYNILLAQPSEASSVLVAAAKSVWLWTSLVDGSPTLTGNDFKPPVNDNNNNDIVIDQEAYLKAKLSADLQREIRLRNRRKRKEGERHTQHGKFSNKKPRGDLQTGKSQLNAGVIPNNQRQNQQTQGGKVKRPYKCRKCTSNHPGRDCQGKKVHCFNCGILGHRAYECYSKSMNKQNQEFPANKSNFSNINLCANNGEDGGQTYNKNQVPVGQGENHAKSPVTMAMNDANQASNGDNGVGDPTLLIKSMNKQDQDFPANKSYFSNGQASDFNLYANNGQAGSQTINMNQAPVGQGDNQEKTPVTRAMNNASQASNRDNGVVDATMLMNQAQTTIEETSFSNRFLGRMQVLFKKFQRGTTTTSRIAMG